RAVPHVWIDFESKSRLGVLVFSTDRPHFDQLDGSSLCSSAVHQLERTAIEPLELHIFQHKTGTPAEQHNQVVHSVLAIDDKVLQSQTIHRSFVVRMHLE